MRPWTAVPVLAGVLLFSGAAYPQTSTVPAVEEIRVVRSIRLSRVEPTEFCSQTRTTFSGARHEDRYAFAAVATRSSDGLVTDAESNRLGTGHGCLGPSADPGVWNLYLEIELDRLRFIGVGRCTAFKADVPETGISTLACFANLSGLAEPHVGGLLTTNTLTSRKGGPESDPAGYLQASIATVRLWQGRGARTR